MASDPMQVVFQATETDWSIESVTVYIESGNSQEDIAEVSRKLHFAPDHPGVFELILEGLPNKIKPESVRADFKAKFARILEVSYDQKWAEKKATEQDAKIKELEEAVTANSSKQAKISAQINWLDKYANGVIPSARTAPGQTVALDNDGGDKSPISTLLMKPETLQKVETFMTFYSAQLAQLEEKLSALQKEAAALARELQSARNAKANTTSNQGEYVRTVSLLLEINDTAKDGTVVEDLSIDIYLIYLVWDTNWKASYDARVQKKEGKVTLTYYGEVMNNTGEDWKNIKLALSTAKPSIGGALPILQPATVGFNVNVYKARSPRRRKKKAARGPRRMEMEQMDMMMEEAEMDDDEMDEEERDIDAMEDNRLEEVGAEVESTGGASSFAIKRLATIKSDKKPHKQAIASIDLAPSFSHAASPKLKPFVFWKCQGTNATTYQLLPGPVAVFIDGSYIANSFLGAVGVGEVFSFFLGIDETVKLDYQPEKTVDDSSSVGLLISKNLLSRTVSRSIKVKNTREEPVRCVLYEQLPVSKDGKIKVTLLQPDIKKKTKDQSFILNELGILEARNVIQPRTEWKIDFSYTVEWPEGRQISISDDTSDEYQVPTNNEEFKNWEKAQKQRKAPAKIYHQNYGLF